MSLEKFADYCDAGVIVATNVDESEQELEGSYWLALLSGPSFALEEDTMHSGQLYRKEYHAQRPTVSQGLGCRNGAVVQAAAAKRARLRAAAC